MQKLETNTGQPAFAVQDTSEWMAVHRLVQAMEGYDALRARVSDGLGKIIAGDMHPEQDPFEGAEAQVIIDAMRAKLVSRSEQDNDVPAIEEMLLEYHDPIRRPRMLEKQWQPERQLIAAGEPSIFEKLRPVKAWRADSANLATAEQQSVEA